MILFRYLTREVLLTMSAVAGILLLVIMGSRFIRYFSDAAEGDFPVTILGSLMVFHLPGFMELILPLSFFLGILLAYGQLYMNSEITVMVACGMSPTRLLRVTLLPATVVAVLVGLCSLWLTPAGALQTEATLEEQRSRLDVSVLAPGRFQDFGGGRTAYITDFNSDGTEMQEVLVHEQPMAGAEKTHSYITRAGSGYQETNVDTGSRFLILENGGRFEGAAGQLNYNVIDFEAYGLKIEGGEAGTKQREEGASTWSLMQSDRLEDRALLHWRFSLPLIVPIVTLLAVRLSRVNPRQGRFFHLLPAMLVYLSLIHI